MTTIVELLDEYGKVSRIYGAALEGPIPSPECDRWFISVNISRAAVDAKIKEMQDVEQSLVDHLKVANDRIAELERENAEFHEALKLSGVVNNKLMNAILSQPKKSG